MVQLPGGKAYALAVDDAADHVYVAMGSGGLARVELDKADMETGPPASGSNAAKSA